MIRSKKKVLPPGSRVMWRWDGQMLEGVIRKAFTHRLERTLWGTTVTQEATRRNPAYLIERDDGDTLLKAHSDLSVIA